MSPAAHLIEAITAAKQAEASARLNRLAAVRAFAGHVRARMKHLKLDRGTVRRRLGWADHTLGNILHLDYCLPDAASMAALAAALGPMTAAEKKAAKRQPKRTKALNS
jgi:hypothetical protein